jgi:small conductance mechanosensitive channel
MIFEILTSVLLILLGAVVFNALVRSGIRRLHAKSARGGVRFRGIALFFHRTSSAFFALVALLMILDVLRVDTGPLLAGLGIAGLLVTLGAQAIFKDVFSGIFVFFEDLYNEGDSIALDETKGIVELLTLRKTVIRDSRGMLHHIPHGSVKIVTVRGRTHARRGI